MRYARLSLVFVLVGGWAIAVQAFTSQDAGKTANSVHAVPDAKGIYSVGNGVTPPRVLNSVDPPYAEEASKKKISGTCVVEFVVDANGIPRDAHITKSVSQDLNLKPKLKKAAEGLDRNAIEAVTQYRFAPAEYQGTPVPVHYKIEITFNAY